MTKVSIIAPFHNTAEYITECLSSLIYQSLEDIEIIFVNDASDDNSENIVKQYAEIDKRIILLNTQKCMGQAAARNLGLEAASGQYIGFVDSDDKIHLDMFEKLYNCAQKNNSDIVITGAGLYDDIEQKYYTNDYYSLKAFERFCGNTFTPAAAKDEILSNPAVIWNKIYRTQFLRENNIKFQNGFIYEDMPFSFETFLKAQKINIVPENLYIYRQNRRFSSMRNTNKKVFDRIPMMTLTYEILKKADFFPEKRAEITAWAIDDIFHRFTLLDTEYSLEYYNKMREFFITLNKDIQYEDKKEILSKSYFLDEFENILKSSYFEFLRFLIEKYKNANKTIKDVKTECNNYIKEVEEKLIYKDEEIQKLHENMVKQEYELKAWEKEAVRQTKEHLTAHYEWKLEELKQHYQNSLNEQKNYYENKYLLVKILLKAYKKAGQLKNKALKVLKKNG